MERNAPGKSTMSNGLLMALPFYLPRFHRDRANPHDALSISGFFLHRYQGPWTRLRMFITPYLRSLDGGCDAVLPELRQGGVSDGQLLRELRDGLARARGGHR